MWIDINAEHYDLLKCKILAFDNGSISVMRPGFYDNGQG